MTVHFIYFKHIYGFIESSFIKVCLMLLSQFLTQKKDFDIESNMIIWKCKHLGLSFNKKSKGSEKQLKGNISQTTSKKQCLQHMLSEL